MNQFTIIINNQSGATQNYALFNRPPIVSGTVQPKIWANVYQLANGTANTAQASFDMWKQYYGICGSSKGGMKDGASVKISMTKPVTLGTLNLDGTSTPGTTLKMLAPKPNYTPSFDPAPQPDTAFPNSFEIDTSDDFTVAIADSVNMAIGLANSPDGSSGTPTATFLPEPNVKYQIQPVNTFYVTFGDFTAGTLIDVVKLGSMTAVDFTLLKSPVTIVHGPTGVLTIQKQH